MPRTISCWSRGPCPGQRTASWRSWRKGRMSSTKRPAASKALKGAVLDAGGKATREVSLDGDVFAAEIKPQLVHETVRSELNARRAGTRGAKSRGQVSGGRSKPWR